MSGHSRLRFTSLALFVLLVPAVSFDFKPPIGSMATIFGRAKESVVYRAMVAAETAPPVVFSYAK